MTRSNLEVFLPILMLFFLVAFLAWNIYFQQRLFQSNKSVLSSLSRINQFFQVMLGLATLIVGLYAFLPEFYFLLIPLDSLDKPLINDAGGLILRVAFFWLLSSMLNTFLMFRKMPEKQKTGDIYVYAQKTVLISVVLLLVGLAVTISSLGAFMLCVLGLYFYYHFYYQAKSY